jgi:hypothetical protein
MAETCETITVERNGNRTLINKGDFNPKTDKKCEADAPESEATPPTSPTEESTGSEATGEATGEGAEGQVGEDAPNEKIDDIVEAIKMLDRKSLDHFTQKGLPRDAALESILGYQVSAEERAEAWNIVQTNEGSAEAPTE